MIELANDSHASRSFERAAPSGEPRARATEMRRPRSGHAWPFLSRYAARPAHEENSPKPAAKDGGS
jgi:hypothetical protein